MAGKHAKNRSGDLPEIELQGRVTNEPILDSDAGTTQIRVAVGNGDDVALFDVIAPTTSVWHREKQSLSRGDLVSVKCTISTNSLTPYSPYTASQIIVLP